MSMDRICMYFSCLKARLVHIPMKPLFVAPVLFAVAVVWRSFLYRESFKWIQLHLQYSYTYILYQTCIFMTPLTVVVIIAATVILHIRNFLLQCSMHWKVFCNLVFSSPEVINREIAKAVFSCFFSCEKTLMQQLQFHRSLGPDQD